MSALVGSDVTYVTEVNKLDETDIVIKTDSTSYHKLGYFFKECQAELLSLCFPNEAINFEQFLFNNHNCDQRKTIAKGLCYLICTWITNEFEIYFHCDAMRIDPAAVNNIKQMITRAELLLSAN